VPSSKSLLFSVESLAGILAGTLLVLLPMTPLVYALVSLFALLIVAHMGWRITKELGIGELWKRAMGAAVPVFCVGLVLYYGWTQRFPLETPSATPIKNAEPTNITSNNQTGGFTGTQSANAIYNIGGNHAAK